MTNLLQSTPAIAIDDEAFNSWTPELDANDYATRCAILDDKARQREIKACSLSPLDYAGYAVCAAIGLVFGLVIASLTVAAVLSNLPQ